MSLLYIVHIIMVFSGAEVSCASYCRQPFIYFLLWWCNL